MKRSVNILTFYQTRENPQRLAIPHGEERLVTVGSQKDKVDIAFKDDRISRIHAQLIIDRDGQCLLIDQGSTNGTFLNGNRIPAHVPTILNPKDEVWFGGSSAGKMLLGESESANDPSIPPRAQDASPSAKVGQSLLSLLQSKPEISIGRSSECDVVLDSSLVSRLHAKLRKLPDGKFMLIDLGSTNGTFLNGQRVHGTVQVQPGDTVIVGRNILSLHHGPKTLTGEIAIRTEGIRKDFPNGKVGLRETNLEIHAGRLVAIMGPSGCGKSTLLKCLTGEAPATQGKVYLHDLELVQNYAFLKTLIGYVPQDDIVHKELTVEQSLYFAARLRMEKPTRLEIETKISEVLQRLRIAHIRQSPIAKISGGQRKRVSIAVELLTDPLVLFLDEPTSPLDPQTIEEFLKILQELAHKGTTVVMVTHKPEDLEYMDSVIFLAEGGAMVYDGNTTDYKAYFGVRTAVEVYANICGERAAGWIQRFQGKGAQPKPVSQVANPRLVKRSDKSLLGELHWLGRRYFRIKTNDLLNVAIMIGQAPIIAALVCLIFSKLTLSVPFLITLSAIWFGTSNAAREIVTEAAVYRRERMFNLRIGPYILSKLLVLAFFGLIQSVLFSVIILIGFQDLNPGWHSLGATIGWIWLLIICATALGLTISALVDTAEKAMTLVPLVLIPQVMLAGVVAPISNQPMEIVSYLSPTRWGNEGLALLQDSVHNSSYDGLSNEIEDEDPFAKDLMRESMDSTVSVREALQDQYHHTYEKRFGNLAYSWDFDLAVLVLMTMSMLTVVAIAMRRKDAL
ncbi:MAG TPA: FHA domain-containing protein [Bacteroidia bacterium]|nr:FHA domain-containing protein [Bacteroidia bacterium]